KFTQEDQTLSAALGNAMAQAMTINRLYSNLKGFKHTLDNTLDSIVMLDPVTEMISYVNRGAITQLNLPAKKLTKTPFTTLLSNSSVPIFRNHVRRLVNKENSSSVFEISFARGKERIPAEIMLQYVRVPSQPAYLLGIMRDLSE